MLGKCCTQYASKFGKLSSGHSTGKGQFSFQSQRKAMSKNAQTTAQLCSSHSLVKWKWKWGRSVVSDSLRPHGLQPTRLLRPWDFPGKSTGVGCHFSWVISNPKRWCWESAALNMPAHVENSAVATGLEKVSFHSYPKVRQYQRMPKLLHKCIHLTR